MRFTRIFSAGLLGLGLALPVSGIVSSAQAETVLQFNRWLPPKHFLRTEVMDRWAADVGKVTNGRVKVQITASSLGPPQRQFDLVKDGVADIAWSSTGYTPGRFKTSQIAEIPFLGNNAESLSVAYWRVYKKHFAKANEYKGVKLLALHVHPPGGLFSNKKPLRSLSDIKGLKLRVLNPGTSRVTRILSGVPVSAPATKAYELLSRGVVDGTYFTSDSIVAFKLAKFINNAIEFEGGIYNTSFFLVFNTKKWNSLSKQDRKAIEGISGEQFAKRIGGVWDSKRAAAYDILVKRGLKVTKLGRAKLATLRAKLSGGEAAWFKTMASMGVDGPAALKMMRAEAAAYK